MKILILGLLSFAVLIFLYTVGVETLAQNCQGTDEVPRRLVIIRGKIMITNHPKLGEIPNSGGTVIFQKVGCNSCFTATNADAEGKYQILVGDGKYKVIYRNPAEPEFDLLTPEQERYVDTESPDAKRFGGQIFDFDIKTRIQKE